MRECPLLNARIISVIAALAMVAMSAVPAAAQSSFNVLLIHGRHSPCPNAPYVPSNGACSGTSQPPEQYGTFTTDQAVYWGGETVSTVGHVIYVQWDAWNNSFDDSTFPGGDAVIRQALLNYCAISKSQSCSIICHSAGCAAIEYVIATSGLVNTSVRILDIKTAGSAAGGSELASLDFGGVIAGIDPSLEPGNARSMYNHDNMHGVPLRAIAGTDNSNPLTQFSFPSQTSKPWNPDCTQPLGLSSSCSDATVALHSACGHNRAASFQDCNSTLTPYTDTAGTYDYHGWWINDKFGSSNPAGPYSTNGKSVYESTFHTYSVNHGGTKILMIQEYNACHQAKLSICP
jgi:hypothetical protein